MDDQARARLEADVRERCEKGAHDDAANVALRGYGPEIYGFLLAFHRDEVDAGDVFSLFSEKLWRGLPTFGWQCSLRTWAYTIARNTSLSFRSSTKKRERRQVALSAAEEIAAQVRTGTIELFKTEQKDRFAALRASLPADEQELLILRVDRGLAWDDLARVLGGEAVDDPAVLKKEAARLRKRFQLVKEKLLEMGRRAGLLRSDE